MLLILLALATAALFLLGIAGRFSLPVATASICLAGAAVAAAALLGGAAPVVLVLPVGLPGTGLTLALDGLSAWFLMLVFVAGAAATIFSLDEPQARTFALLPVFIGAMALTLLAGDGFSLLLGFELMSLASWGLVVTRSDSAAGLLYLGMAGLAGFCLITTLGLLAVRGPGDIIDLGFPAIRAAPPDGWRAGIAVVVLVLGVGSKAGLAPLHAWLPPAHAAAPSHVSALMSGAMTKVALYVLIRVLFDLAGPAPPLWWGLLLVVVGGASAVLGGLRACLEADIKTVLACSTIENVGLIAIGLGVALAARAADITPLASLALGTALLHALAHGVFKPLLFLVAGAVQRGAATRLLSRLGGLVHRMPVTTGCALVGAAALAALPPGPGFASEWLLFQSVLGAPRIGGLAVQTLFAVVLGAMALAVALAGVAAVRLVGVAFLGRPRTPRGAAAEEAGPWARGAMIGLAILGLLLGLLPGPLLQLAEPALHQMLRGTLADRAGILAVTAQAESPGYGAPGIALLLAVIALVALGLLRRFSPRGIRRVPAWAGGFAQAPAWLPFGDPLTQYGGASFSQILRRTFGTTLLDARETVTMPAPGDVGPAVIATASADPSETWLFDRAAWLRAWLGEAIDRAQFVSIHRILTVMFGMLVLFLTIVAVMEAR